MKFLWQLNRKNIIFLSIAASVLTSCSLMLTFLMSDGNKVAMNAVFQSADVMKNIGRVDKIILTGSSSQYSGSAGCADFRYLVLGETGKKIINVRVEKTDNTEKAWRVLELVEGLGADFDIPCWRRKEK